MDADKTCTATFNLTPPSVTASKEASNATTGSLTSFTPGGTINYTVVLTNPGVQAQPDNAGDEFTDTIPISALIPNSGATASAGTISYDNATRTYSWNGSIPPGGSVTLSFSVRIPTGVTGTQRFCNQGTALVDTDLNGSNETSVLTSDPTPLAGAPGTQTCVDVTGRSDIFDRPCPPRFCLQIGGIEAQWSVARRAIGFFVQGTGIKAINVQLFSLTGKRVYASGWMENGYKWRLQNLNGRPMANGVYLYIVTVRGYDGQSVQTQVKKIVINR